MRVYLFRGRIATIDGPKNFRADDIREFINLLFRNLRTTDLSDVGRRLDFLTTCMLEMSLDATRIDELFPKIASINGIAHIELGCWAPNPEGLVPLWHK